jgi:hypothetical protein
MVGRACDQARYECPILGLGSFGTAECLLITSTIKKDYPL